MIITAAPTERSLRKPREFRIVNEQPVAFSDLVVHSFTVAELEDSVIHAAGYLLDWEYSEAGAWVRPPQSTNCKPTKLSEKVP